MVSQKPWKRKRKKIVLGARLAYERLCPSEMGRAGQGSEEEEEPKGANYASAIPTLTSAPHLSGRLGSIQVSLNIQHHCGTGYIKRNALNIQITVHSHETTS